MAQVLAVISGKGGTGKTSLCAGVASCLAMEGQRVLCVDLDVGLRNLDIALGMADMAAVYVRHAWGILPSAGVTAPYDRKSLHAHGPCDRER